MRWHMWLLWSFEKECVVAKNGKDKLSLLYTTQMTKEYNALQYTPK